MREDPRYELNPLMRLYYETYIERLEYWKRRVSEGAYDKDPKPTEQIVTEFLESL